MNDDHIVIVYFITVKNVHANYPLKVSCVFIRVGSLWSETKG